MLILYVITLHQVSFHLCLSHWQITFIRKHNQIPADPKTTMILTHKEDTKASSIKAFHRQYHKIEQIDPITAPTITWLTV
jgi:hypothetical protein